MNVEAKNGLLAINKHGMSYPDVRIAFPCGLVRSYLEFVLSFGCSPRVLIPFKVIATEHVRELKTIGNLIDLA